MYIIFKLQCSNDRLKYNYIGNEIINHEPEVYPTVNERRVCILPHLLSLNLQYIINNYCNYHYSSSKLAILDRIWYLR